MKLTFNINYRTRWGESLYLSGSTSVLGDNDPNHAVKMEFRESERWTVTIDIPHSIRALEYRYFVRHDSGNIIDECGAPHIFRPAACDTYHIYDRWQDRPWDNSFYSSAFTDCICHRSQRAPEIMPKRGHITFSVSAPLVKSDEIIALSGACPAMGSWNVDKAIPLSDAHFPVWTCNVSVSPEICADTEYKFLIINKHTGQVISWEGGENRRLLISPLPDAATEINGLHFISTRPLWKGAGTAIPVFSLRSEDDFGVGDFIDLIKLIDWAKSTGQTFIQILPINDTTMTGTWTDSYPYNANSTFALHPMYLRTSMLGRLRDTKRRKYYDNLAHELNSLKEIDYERVTSAKAAFTREIFEQEGAATLASPEFKTFLRQNADWLEPYAAFCVLRDRFGTADYSQWDEYATYDPEKIKDFAAQNASSINLVYYVQFHLDKQLRQVRDYAHSYGIAIKGDIPIGISRTSVDAWCTPHLFNLGCQAGAPPDDFSVLGQNWGFPTYNWDEMSRDGFAWWKARFRKMSEYFDAYRIDHVLGFFRIWQIPMDQIHGLLGYFSPALPYSAEEMRNNYDFWIDVNLYTTPYIMDYFLGDFFGQYTDEARSRFLSPLGYGRYRLKDEFSTQRKVADYFGSLEKNEKNARLRDALLGLIDDVLFIPDPDEPGKYHPRISAQYTYIYRSLSDYERWCFDRLYNDFFYHRHNDFWYGKAMWKLPPLINSTRMLVCAEDLGMIPACVPAVMDTLQMLSLEIQRMPKAPTDEFGDTWHYPYLSVCTTSTHDMSGIRAWWEENRRTTQDYYNNVLHESGDAPYFAEPWICEKILDLHLKTPSMLCIIPLQDWLSMDGALRRESPAEERINIPANSRHYWRYRMHLTLEELQQAGTFNSHLADMIAGAGR